MSRRRLVWTLVFVPVVVAFILLHWRDFMHLPSLSAWRDWRHEPGLLAETALACLATLLFSSCVLHVGFGRWAKVAGLVALLGLALCGLGFWGIHTLSRYEWSSAEQFERFLRYDDAAVAAAETGLQVFIGGAALLILALTVRTWKYRKEVFPFLYRESGPDRS